MTAKRYDTVGVWSLDEAAARYPGALGGVYLAPLLHVGFAEHRLKTVMWQGKPYTSIHWIHEYMRAGSQASLTQDDNCGPVQLTSTLIDADQDAVDEDSLALGDFHEQLLDLNDEPLGIDDTPLPDDDRASDVDLDAGDTYDGDGAGDGVTGDFSYTIEGAATAERVAITLRALTWLQSEHPGLYWLVSRWREIEVDSDDEAKEAGVTATARVLAEIAEEAGVGPATIKLYLRKAHALCAEELYGRPASTSGSVQTKRKGEIGLSSAAWDAMPDYGQGSRSYWGLPGNAKTPSNYIAVLEEVDPKLAKMEQMVVVNEMALVDVARTLGVAPSTVYRGRERGHKIFHAWYEKNMHNPLRDDATDRKMYRLWRAGADIPTIAAQIPIPRPIVERKVGYFSRNRKLLSRYMDPEDEQQQRPARQPRGPYKTGDTTKGRIRRAIIELTQLSGEPPTSRQIQAEIRAKSKIDYHLSRMKAQGLIRMSAGGYGYEVVAETITPCPKFAAKGDTYSRGA